MGFGIFDRRISGGYPGIRRHRRQRGLDWPDTILYFPCSVLNIAYIWLDIWATASDAAAINPSPMAAFATVFDEKPAHLGRIRHVHYE
jgi:hypothetical protein